MKIFADESVDGPIVERLRQDGHQVVYAAEAVSGITDDEILKSANDQEALLLTADKDFGEMVFKWNRLHTDGVVLIRLAGLTPTRKAAVASKAFREYQHEFSNAFSVISPGRTRVRSQS
jgi:predicted nuclease of predicted toxin-antitoxin system